MLDSSRPTTEKAATHEQAMKAAERLAEMLGELDDAVRLLALAGKGQNQIIRMLAKRVAALEAKEK